MPGIVLIVDDCVLTAVPLEIALAGLDGVQVMTLASAQAALKVLANKDYQVAAIVTDLHLPLMNGFELIEHIRRDTRYSNLPIVVVTGDGNPTTRTRAIEKGANSYFPKPYSPSDLRDELERLIYGS